MKLKIRNVRGYKAGEVVTVQTDSHSLPLDLFWRKRLRDAVIDNCVEVVKPTKSRKEITNDHSN